MRVSIELHSHFLSVLSVEADRTFYNEGRPDRSYFQHVL